MSALVLALLCATAAERALAANDSSGRTTLVSGADRASFREHGFLLLENVFPAARLDAIKQAVESHLARNRHLWVEGNNKGTLLPYKGLKLPNFMGSPLSPALLKALPTDPRMLQALEELAGSEHPGYRFMGADNLGINRTIAWHRDLLAPSPFNFAHMRRPSWEDPRETPGGGSHGLDALTVAIFLQDTTGTSALSVKRGTHRELHFCSTTPAGCGDGEPILVRKGALVIFDRRLLHRGPVAVPAPGGMSRALVTLIFGARNSSHSDELEAAYAASEAELVHVRAPTEHFLRARAPEGHPGHAALERAYAKYSKCMYRLPTAPAAKAAALALAADPVGGPREYVRRKIGACAQPLMATPVGSELKAWVERS